MRLVFLLTLPGLLLAQSDWPGYGRDPFGQRHSPLTQINTSNVARLKPAWQYALDPKPEGANGSLTATEAVPIMVGGILYSPTRERTIVALDPETGKELWKYALGNVGAPLRGVSYWAGDKEHPASILAGTGDGKLIEINAKTGKLVPGFGNEGELEGRRLRALSRRTVSHGLSWLDLSQLDHNRRAR
jgi:quinoprotein glucose dehydrogenase